MLRVTVYPWEDIYGKLKIKLKMIMSIIKLFQVMLIYLHKIDKEVVQIHTSAGSFLNDNFIGLNMIHLVNHVYEYYVIHS